MTYSCEMENSSSTNQAKLEELERLHGSDAINKLRELLNGRNDNNDDNVVTAASPSTSLAQYVSDRNLYLSDVDEHFLLTNDSSNTLPLPRQNEDIDPIKYLDNVNPYPILDEQPIDLLDDGDFLSTPLLPIVVSKNNNSTTPPWWKWRIPAEQQSPRPRYYYIFLIFSLILVTLVCMVERVKPAPCWTADDDDNIPNPEPANRTFYATQCATKLSETTTSLSLSPQNTAIQWFVSGEGRFMDIPPSIDKCTWNTTFGTFYALLIIRESLNVSPWKSYKNIITNISDACHHWTRIGCNDDNTVITKLYFNNAGLVGQIPKEIAGLGYIERLEFQSNNIMGTIAPELGKMSNLGFLYLHKTLLSGTIPNSLGNLNNLQELLLDHSKLQGSMPDSICNLRSKNLRMIHADCEGVPPLVSCSCCDECFHI